MLYYEAGFAEPEIDRLVKPLFQRQQFEFLGSRQFGTFLLALGPNRTASPTIQPTNQPQLALRAQALTA
jgi:hypothetical protein